MGARDGLGAMPLYVNLHRIYNELAEAGVAAGAPLTPEQLFPFDQIHYHGTDAVTHAAETLQLTSESRVLEIGSGLGGPARFLAHTVGCHVTALDIQDEMHTIASDLTRRAGLAGTVTHVLGDALSYPFPDPSFDAVVSWLAIHHIPDRPRLLERLRQALRPGGWLYVEDLYARAPFKGDDVADVKHVLYGVTMTGVEEYQREVNAAGFTVVEMSEMSGPWGAFCAERAAAWKAAADRHVRVHGIETYATLEGFFTTVQRLFERGSLGGLRLLAQVPKETKTTE
ncbi:MAG: methyltransferase domain-containing protein [Acidimicrobiia bacterium]|nr:methyltransferase domain-containing protein [Acidimicrobiia bacterium]